MCVFCPRSLWGLEQSAILGAIVLPKLLYDILQVYLKMILEILQAYIYIYIHTHTHYRYTLYLGLYITQTTGPCADGLDSGCAAIVGSPPEATWSQDVIGAVWIY